MIILTTFNSAVIKMNELDRAFYKDVTFQFAYFTNTLMKSHNNFFKILVIILSYNIEEFLIW